MTTPGCVSFEGLACVWYYDSSTTLGFLVTEPTIDSDDDSTADVVFTIRDFVHGCFVREQGLTQDTSDYTYWQLFNRNVIDWDGIEICCCPGTTINCEERTREWFYNNYIEIGRYVAEVILEMAQHLE